MIVQTLGCMAKPIDPRVVDLNARIFAGRLDLRQVLNRAGVPRSTWWRWVKLGSDPRRDTLAKIDSAITAKLIEKEEEDGRESRHDTRTDA